ncbi:MAG: hypothetical protein SX243_21390 [Acidobacteriota bacterium]|nr:hypothetical protein [Acidobacteriota bacterium]
MSDRKYRQRGYQDSGDDSRRERRKPSGPRPSPTDRPRGRGLGAPKTEVFRCHSCGEKQSPPGVQQFEEQCRKCGTALHSCVHCVYFDTSARHECRQPVKEPVRSKTKANQCELFEPKVAQEFGADSADQSDARSAFDALFKL